MKIWETSKNLWTIRIHSSSKEKNKRIFWEMPVEETPTLIERTLGLRLLITLKISTSTSIFSLLKFNSR